MPFLWRFREVYFPLFPNPDSTYHQHSHVCLHCIQHLQEQVTCIFFQPFLLFFTSSQSNSTSKKTSRSEKADKMCIYLRLFFGMGIIWYFELLAFALAPYNLNPNVFVLTDTLNMLQVDRP